MGYAEQHLNPRKKKDVIADAQWIVLCQLEIAGQPVGEPLRRKYADSQLGGDPRGCGDLIAMSMNEAALRLKPPKKRPVRKKT